MSPISFSIPIGIDPVLFSLGSFVLTWHGFFTFVAVALGIILIARSARREGISPEIIYSISIWAILGGIIGARAVHVIDRWDFYGHNLSSIFTIWTGGIAILGAILGGFAAGYTYCLIANRLEESRWAKTAAKLGVKYESIQQDGHLLVRPSEDINEDTLHDLKKQAGIRFKQTVAGVDYFRLRNYPAARIADLATPSLLISMTVGRLGDIINGEHFAMTTSMPWGFIYTHPKTQVLYSSANISSLSPTHPAIAYEMLLNLAVLGVVWLMRGRLKPDGMTFALYLASYSLGRFFISFLRLDKEWLWGMNQAQLISIVILAITVPLLVYRAQFIKKP